MVEDCINFCTQKINYTLFDILGHQFKFVMVHFYILNFKTILFLSRKIHSLTHDSNDYTYRKYIANSKPY